MSGLSLEEQQRLVEIMVSINHEKSENEIEKARIQSFEARFEASRLLLESVLPFSQLKRTWTTRVWVVCSCRRV